MVCFLDERIVADIQNIASNYSVEKIVLFGSRARGDNKPTSDIDLAIFSLPQFKNKGHFVSEFDDINTLLKIDLVFINKDIDPKLLENIEREGVIVYERLQAKV